MRCVLSLIHSLRGWQRLTPPGTLDRLEGRSTQPGAAGCPKSPSCPGPQHSSPRQVHLPCWCHVISSSIHAYHYTHTAKNVFCREVTIILETASSVRPGMWYCELNHSLPGWQPHVGILKVPAGPLCSSSLLMYLEGSRWPIGRPRPSSCVILASPALALGLWGSESADRTALSPSSSY